MFTGDDVMQFLIEEALMTRVDVVRIREKHEQHNRAAVKAAQERAAADIERRRRSG